MAIADDNSSDNRFEFPSKIIANERERERKMEDLKKRKLEETINSENSESKLRVLIEPLSKNQLVDLLAKFGCQYGSIAEEIRSIASSDPAHRKLFVRGLSWDTSSASLRAAFQVHGEVEEGSVIIDKATGKSRGFGFITYKHMESAQSALKEPSKLIDGRLAVCNLACEDLNSTSAPTDLAQRKLFIGGLSQDTTTEMLLSFFGRHGEIEEGSVAYDKDTNVSRGFGFVTYKTMEAAKKAIDDPQKTIGGKIIIVKFADNQRAKTTLPQIPTARVPAQIPVTPSYPQTGKPYPGTMPTGYLYPQMGATYPHPSYPSPQTPVASYSYQQAYPPFSARREQFGPQTHQSLGMGGYPYYFAKQ